MIKIFTYPDPDYSTHLSKIVFRNAFGRTPNALFDFESTLMVCEADLGDTR